MLLLHFLHQTWLQFATESYLFSKIKEEGDCKKVYRTQAIKSRGSYIFYPISNDHLFVFKEAFSENSVLMYGLQGVLAWYDFMDFEKSYYAKFVLASTT